MEEVGIVHDKMDRVECPRQKYTSVAHSTLSKYPISGQLEWTQGKIDVLGETSQDEMLHLPGDDDIDSTMCN